MLGVEPPVRELQFDQLIAQRPSSHAEGLLPRRYVAPDETILYETRPSFVGYALPGVIGGAVGAVALVILYYVFAGAQTSAGGSQGVDPSALAILWALLIVAVLASAIGVVVRWWFTTYAVTTTRILVKEGAWSRRIIDIPNNAVQSVMFEESAFGRSYGYGTLQFSSASVAGFGLSSLRSRPGVINWRASPHPLETRAFFETVKKARFE